MGFVNNDLYAHLHRNIGINNEDNIHKDTYNLDFVTMDIDFVIEVFLTANPVNNETSNHHDHVHKVFNIIIALISSFLNIRVSNSGKINIDKDVQTTTCSNKFPPLYYP